MPLQRLWWILVVLAIVMAPTLSQFTEPTYLASDSVITSGDDNCDVINLQMPMSYFGRTYTKLWVCTNGRAFLRWALL